MAEITKNWSGSYSFSTGRLHHPRSVEEVQALMKQSKQVKVLGAGHSFNRIADSNEDMILLDRMQAVLEIDEGGQTVTVEGGIRYSEMCLKLHEAGYALRNMASLPHVTVAGACSTATHGSGTKNGNLATAVSGLELVTGEGEVVTLTREKDGDEFLGMVVGLGGLGVVTKLTLDIIPAFDMRQDVYVNMPLAQLEANFDAVMSSAYSVSLFTDWKRAHFNQVWLKRIIEDADEFVLEPEFYGANLGRKNYHPIGELLPDPTTEQMGVRGFWYDRLPHFRINFPPSAGNELQTEYFVAREGAYEALLAVEEIHEQLAPVLMISEIRTVAADDLWMSMCYQRDSVGIHFTWKMDLEGVTALLPVIEAQLAPFDARPHWGKLFAMPPERLEALYPRMGDFRQLLQKYDPQGKFRNAYIAQHILGHY